MSGFNAILSVMAVGIANTFLYVFIDKWIRNREKLIVSGMVRGVQTSVHHRRMELQTRWVSAVGGQIVVQAFVLVGWLLIARNSEAEEVRAFAYLAALVSGGGTVGWITMSPLWYRHLASILRQAEAD